MRHHTSKEKDAFHESQELLIHIPALQRPTLRELQAAEPWIESIERDTSPEVPVTLNLEALLHRSVIDSIHGVAYKHHILSKRNFTLGYQHLEWLLQHQYDFPVISEYLGQFYIDFPGVVVVHRVINHRVPYCRALGNRWERYWHGFPDRFLSFGRVAVAFS